MINTPKETLLLALIVVAVVIGQSWTTGAQTIGGIGTRRVLAIRNVTVIPATGAPPIANGTIVIRGEHIVAVGPGR